MSEDRELQPEEVAAWLRRHPDFFHEHEDLLELLRLPDPRGEAVSLLERQAQILRERNHALKERLQRLLNVARENEALFEKTRRLVLTLIESRSPEQLFAGLIRSLQQDFGSDTVALLVYDRDLNLAGEVRRNVRCLAFPDLPEPLQVLLRNGRAICGTLREEEISALFPEQADQVGSAAMVPLEYQGRQGLLAIGSHDIHHFRSSLDTLFISHLGEVLSRRLHDLLLKYPRLDARNARSAEG